MREIKFRGKCKWENHPRYGEWIIAPDQIDISELWKMVEQQDGIDPSTVGQFTGLKDSKGVEIYEGDIIQSVSIPEIKATVEFTDGQFTGFVAFNFHDLSIARGWSSSVTVIGNIHDKENNNDQS